jgi:hypothetical protein
VGKAKLLLSSFGTALVLLFPKMATKDDALQCLIFWIEIVEIDYADHQEEKMIVIRLKLFITSLQLTYDVRTL